LNSNDAPRKIRDSFGKIFAIPVNLLLKRYLSNYLLRQYLVWGDESKLSIAPTASVNNTIFNVESGKIVIGDYVFCGHNVCILTATHDYTKLGSRECTQFLRQVGILWLKKECG
jgi:hypothetical protein